MASVSEFSYPTETKAQGKEAAVKCKLLLCVPCIAWWLLNKGLFQERGFRTITTVTHCPSLSRKKTNLRSLLREMAIYEIIVWEAELPLTGHSRVVQNRSPSDNPVTQKCVFRNCSYKDTASWSELWLLKSPKMDYTQIVKWVWILTTRHTRPPAFGSPLKRNKVASRPNCNNN